MQTIENSNERGSGVMTAQLCPRCRFHPASPRIAGYCSWDCYEADDEEDDAEPEKSEKAA